MWPDCIVDFIWTNLLSNAVQKKLLQYVSVIILHTCTCNIWMMLNMIYIPAVCSYGSWIYNYLCNQCLSPLKLWVLILLRQCILDTTLCDKVCQWLATGRWFSSDTLVSFASKIDRHDITEILLKVPLNTKALPL
jgi:hypothetical protein